MINVMIEGYKQTELGLIPEDWNVKKLEEISKIYDGTHSTPHYVEQGIPFYSVEQLTSNDFTKTKYISEEVFIKENKRVKLEYGDILITRIGDIGTAKYIDWEVNASFYVSLALIKSISKDSNFKFLNYFINSDIFKHELYKRILHVAFPKKINLGDIGKCMIFSPPIEEQKAIADCLSTWDEAIEKQEQLIKSKENRHKALMQRLLSGKKRLPGFSEDWKEVKLEEISLKKASNLQANNLTENTGQYNVYGASGIANKVDFYTENEGYIGIVKDGSGVGNLFLCEPKSSVLGTLDIIIPKNCNLIFLYNILQNIDYNKYKVGGAIPHIYYKSYSKEVIKLPSLVEQEKIADILDSSLIEIELEKLKVSQLKEQKKALMQKLLTGRVRLPLKN